MPGFDGLAAIWKSRCWISCSLQNQKTHPKSVSKVAMRITRSESKQQYIQKWHLRCVNLFLRWWFQTFFIFTPIWGRFPIWLIFSDGLVQPPTRQLLNVWWISFLQRVSAFVRHTWGVDTGINIFVAVAVKVGNQRVYKRFKHPPFVNSCFWFP